jgi:hypothetical protein
VGSEMAFLERVLQWVSALVLPLWSVVSWKAMHDKSLAYWKIICYYGIVIETIHISVIVMAAQHLDRTMYLLVFVFSSLHVVETVAYLMITTNFRRSFVNDRGTQPSLLWGNQQQDNT